MRYAMIDELRLSYPVTGLCDRLDLSVGGYYSWRDRPMSQRAQEDARFEVVIRAVHKRHRETCGPERLQQDIAAHDGVQVVVLRVKRTRKQLGLRCKQEQKFKATTNSKYSLPVVENLLGQKFEATAPNQVWLIAKKSPPVWLIHHSDRGSQYFRASLCPLDIDEPLL